MYFTNNWNDLFNNNERNDQHQIINIIIITNNDILVTCVTRIEFEAFQVLRSC